MFSQEKSNSVDPKYFNIILLDPYDVSTQSRNTVHYRSLYCSGVSGNNACLVYHKHRFSHPYHQHGYGNSLRQAIWSIKFHDRW